VHYLISCRIRFPALAEVANITPSPGTDDTEVSAVGCAAGCLDSGIVGLCLRIPNTEEWIPGDEISRSTAVQVCQKVNSSSLIGYRRIASPLPGTRKTRPARYGDDSMAIITDEESGDSLWLLRYTPCDSKPGHR
jgi:hypothetical protein